MLSDAVTSLCSMGMAARDAAQRNRTDAMMKVDGDSIYVSHARVAPRS
jgi:hypothetical protein